MILVCRSAGVSCHVAYLLTDAFMWGQMSFCRRNVLTMIFVVDPATELGLSVISYMIGSRV